MWTEYWRGGRQSCLDEMPVASRQHLEALWRTWFADLPPATALLDCATGSGDVARLAWQIGNDARRNLQIVGVDLALIEPDASISDANSILRLAGGVDLARLPFPCATFDCAVSQFGVEYAKATETLPEIARVLRPGGRGLFIMHHAGSAITLAARERIAAFSEVVGGGRAFELGARLFELMARRAPQGDVAAASAQFGQSVQDLHNALSARPVADTNVADIVSFLFDLARTARLVDPLDALRRLAEARERIAAWALRQQAQIAAARDRDGIQVFKAALENHGLASEDPAEIRDADGILLAWQCAFFKPSAGLPRT
jgi:SAM-dependent methyltransferase